MQSEDRPIHFSTELIHAPRQHSLAALQKLYFELSQVKQAGYLSSDLSPHSPPRYFTKRGKRTQSTAVFLPDRILIAEEWVDIPVATFLERVDAVAEYAGRELGIDSFLVHTATLRTTFALTNHDDARVFVFERMCAQAGRIGPYLSRPIAVGGLRFVLPETPEHEGTLHVIVESFRYSRNEVFVEVKGVFGREPVTLQSLDILRKHFQLLRTFVTERIHPYLAQFDVPVEGAL